MKKVRLIVISIVALITTLVVSSFAWFQIGNNGILSTTVGTTQKIAVYFNEAGSNDESMMPAKLKKGVINDPSGTINGDSKEDLSGRKLLPKTENYKYVLENSNFVTQSEYLESPATIVYSQFEAIINDNTGQLAGKQKLIINFDVRYYNVDEDENNEITTLTPFTQTEALTFNFFVLTSPLSKEQLQTISTNIGDDKDNLTVEDFIYTNRKTNENPNGVVLHYEGIESVDDPNFSLSTVRDYCYEPTLDGNKYVFTMDKLNLGQIYYILIESYYSLPDQLIIGNLPLTGQFVLNVSFDNENSN